MKFNWFNRNKNPEIINSQESSNTQEGKIEAVPVEESVVEPKVSKPETSGKGRRKKRWEKRAERKAGKANRGDAETVKESPANPEEPATVENKAEELTPEKSAELSEQALVVISEAAQEEIARNLDLTVGQKQELMKSEVAEEIKQSVAKKKFLGERAVDALVGFAGGATGVAAVKMLASYGLRSSLKRMIDIGAPGMGFIVGAAVGGSFELAKTWRNESKRVEEERKTSLESISEISQAHKEKLSGLKGKKRMEALMKLRQEADLSEQEQTGLNELYEKLNNSKIDKKKIGIAVLKGAAIGGLGGAVGGVVAEKLFGAASVVNASVKEAAPGVDGGTAVKTSLTEWMKSHSGDIVKGKVIIPAEINADITANVEKNVWTTVKEYLKAHGIDKPSNALINEATRKITDLNNVEITSDHATEFGKSVHHHMENGVKDILMQKGHEIHHLESLNDLIKANGGSVDSLPAEINIQAPGNIPAAGLPPHINMQEVGAMDLSSLKKAGYIVGSLAAGYGFYRLYKKMRKSGEVQADALGLNNQAEEGDTAEDNKPFETMKEANSLFEEATRAMEDYDLFEAREKLIQAEEKLRRANGGHLRSGQKNRLRGQKRDLGEKIKAAQAEILAGLFWGKRENNKNNQPEKSADPENITNKETSSTEQKSRVAYFKPPVETNENPIAETEDADINPEAEVILEAELDERQRYINNKLNERLADWRVAVEKLEQAARAGNREEYERLLLAAGLAKKEINTEGNKLTAGLDDYHKKTKWFKSKKAEMEDLDSRTKKSKDTLDLAESGAKAEITAESLENKTEPEAEVKDSLQEVLSPYAQILMDRLNHAEAILNASQNAINRGDIELSEREFNSAKALWKQVDLGDSSNFKSKQEQYILSDKKHDLRAVFDALRDSIDSKKVSNTEADSSKEQSDKQAEDALDEPEDFETKYERLASYLDNRIKSSSKLINEAEKDFDNKEFEPAQNKLNKAEASLGKVGSEILAEKNLEIKKRLEQELRAGIVKAAKKGQNLKQRLENLNFPQSDTFKEIDTEYSRAAGVNQERKKIIQRFNGVNDFISELENAPDAEKRKKLLNIFPSREKINNGQPLPEELEDLYTSFKDDAVNRLKEMGESELVRQIQNPIVAEEEKDLQTEQEEVVDIKIKNEGRDLKLNEDKWLEIVGQEGLLEKVVGEEDWDGARKQLISAIKQFNKNHQEPLVAIYEKFLTQSFSSDTAGRLVDELSTLSDRMINIENTARKNLNMPRRKIKPGKKKK